MRRVRCYECGKRYDFDVDDFCPKCGAFNQPDRTSRIGADGSVIRVDGLNEESLLFTQSFMRRTGNAGTPACQREYGGRARPLSGRFRLLEDGEARTTLPSSSNGLLWPLSA